MSPRNGRNWTPSLRHYQDISAKKGGMEPLLQARIPEIIFPLYFCTFFVAAMQRGSGRRRRIENKKNGDANGN